MRAIRPAAARGLRTSTASQTSQSPFRTRTAAPCIFCAHRTQPLAQPQSLRFQSTSSSPKTHEEPFNTPSSSQPTTPQTHYDFFPQSLSSGAPPNAPFTIDLSALKREFLQLQARAHPDMHPQSSKKRAEALSARINDAYKTLQNPLLRAQYLLSLRGIEVAEDETAKVEDPELLMEVLEAREEIEEVDNEEGLVEMRRVNEERIRRSEEVLERAFREDDLRAAKEEAVRLRYWANIRESIDGWEKGKPVVLQH